MQTEQHCRPDRELSASSSTLRRMDLTEGSPQLLLSLRVLVQMGLKMVPHLVVPPVHWKMQVPWLQMVMAEGSVGQTVPHEPLQTAQNRSFTLRACTSSCRKRLPSRSASARKAHSLSSSPAYRGCPEHIITSDLSLSQRVSMALGTTVSSTEAAVSYEGDHLHPYPYYRPLHCAELSL